MFGKSLSLLAQYIVFGYSIVSRRLSKQISKKNIDIANFHRKIDVSDDHYGRIQIRDHETRTDPGCRTRFKKINKNKFIFILICTLDGTVSLADDLQTWQQRYFVSKGTFIISSHFGGLSLQKFWFLRSQWGPTFWGN